MDLVSQSILAVILAAIVIAIIVKLLAWLYMKSSGEVAFVRTGFGGSKIVRNGGAIVVPVLHQTMPVSLNTMRLEVSREGKESLKTLDRMLVNVSAAFYIHVQPTAEAIARAAETLGSRTTNPQAVRELLEGRFVDALRAVAAEMELKDLHERRAEYVARVGDRVTPELAKNGLKLESVSLLQLDQAPREFFDPSNALDAEGLTALSRQIEDRRRVRNEIERDTELAIQRKALDVEKKQLEIEKEQLQIGREVEHARLQQQQEIAVRRAAQSSEISREQAEQRRRSEEARLAAERHVQRLIINTEMEIEREKIDTDHSLKIARIESEQVARERDVMQRLAIDLATLRQRTSLQLAELDREIEVSSRERAREEALAHVDAAKLLARKLVNEADIHTMREIEQQRILAERQVSELRLEKEQTLRQLEINKQKVIELASVEYRRIADAAEQDREIASALKSVDRYAALARADETRASAVSAEQVVAREIERVRAETRRMVQEIEATRAQIEADGLAKAEQIRLAALARQYEVEATGKRAIYEAENQLNERQVGLKVKLASLERLPDIIRESAKPMEQIDSIKIVQVEGITGSANSSTRNGAAAAAGDHPLNGAAPAGSFAEQVMSSALRYRAQAPLVESVLREVGLDGTALNGLTEAIRLDADEPKPKRVESQGS